MLSIVFIRNTKATKTIKLTKVLVEPGLYALKPRLAWYWLTIPSALELPSRNKIKILVTAAKKKLKLMSSKTNRS
jgi:hypothetical protein